jgi:hypothetical protein
VKDWYIAQGAVPIEEPLTRVCGPIKDQPCTIISRSILSNIIFNEDNSLNNMNLNDVKNFKTNCKSSNIETKSCFIKCKILDSIHYDMIIGREDIIKNNLLNLIETKHSSKPKQMSLVNPQKGCRAKKPLCTGLASDGQNSLCEKMGTQQWYPRVNNLSGVMNH